MEFDWIEAGILAASACPTDANDIRSLHRQGIRAIVTLTERPLTDLDHITPELFRELDITCLHAPVIDFQAPSPARAWGVIAFIDQMRKENRPVLLHCLAGQGRTGAMLHVYYLAQGMSLEGAKARVAAVRPASAFDFGLSQAQQRFVEAFAAGR